MVYTAAAKRVGFERKGGTTSNQGGAVFTTDALTKLRRFLILGTDQGSYYVPAQELTQAAAGMLIDAFNELGTEAIDEIVAISEAGRAPKNDPALFALACAAAYEHENKHVQRRLRAYALYVLPRVARTGTHLFTFVAFVNNMRGWGRSLQNGVQQWYLSKSPYALAQQVTKYAQRNGWSHADVLRKAHPTPTDETYGEIFNFVVDDVVPNYFTSDATRYLGAVEMVKHPATTVEQVIELIKEYNLPREVIPTQWLNEPEVWRALFPTMGLTALLRNLGTLTKHGILAMGTDETKVVVQRLTDATALKKARIHPINVLMAFYTYRAGRGVRSKATWTPVQAVVDALEAAFYASFANVEPYRKDTLIAIDVSPSMESPANLCGVPGLSPRTASALMAMIVARTEPSYEVMAFNDSFQSLNVGKHDSLDAIVQKMGRFDWSWGGTDCTLPVRYAAKHKLPIEAFVVYTDSENGNIEDVDTVLRNYRAKHQPDAKMVVQQMVYNEWSLLPPCDYSLNMVGLDSASPALTSDYLAGRL